MAAPSAKSVKVGSLLLDPRNSRIPSEQRTEDQRALLHELVNHEDVKGLASSIAKLGLFPHERLVVLSGPGRSYTVLEGNRRLAAIKLLLNPELAQTEGQVRDYRRLARKADLVALGKVEVTVVRSRIDAAPIIAALHTKNPKRRWKAVQKARFYRELIEEGQTAVEVADELGVPLGEVNSYLRSELLYRMALTLDYPEDIRSKIADRTFSLTTLDRFLESSAGQKFLGIKPDADHELIGTVHVERFRAVLKKVAEDVATEPRLSRTINRTKDLKEYVAKAEEEIPKTRKRGNFTPREFFGDEAEKEVGKTPPKVKKKRKPRTSNSVVPIGFSCATRHRKVRTIFQELRAMKIQSQPNSSGVMLRVLVDVALWCFYKDQGLDKAVCDHFDANGRQRKKNPDWTPTLRQLISYADSKHIFPGLTADGYKALRTLLAKDQSTVATIDTLNEYTHNPQVQPTEPELRAVWQRMEPMFEIILS